MRLTLEGALLWRQLSFLQSQAFASCVPKGRIDFRNLKQAVSGTVRDRYISGRSPDARFDTPEYPN
jgi:hypothetical protein